MGYVITDRAKKGKRIRLLDGSLTPFFKYPEQVLQYIKKHLNNSAYAYIHKVKDKEVKNVITKTIQ